MGGSGDFEKQCTVFKYENEKIVKKTGTPGNDSNYYLQQHLKSVGIIQNICKICLIKNRPLF